MLSGDEFYDDDITSPHDRLAVMTFGVTRRFAHARRICIRCRSIVAGLAPLDEKEYAITALCPSCFVALTPEDE